MVGALLDVALGGLVEEGVGGGIFQRVARACSEGLADEADGVTARGRIAGFGDSGLG